jgi:hypothetical protein
MNSGDWIDLLPEQERAQRRRQRRIQRLRSQLQRPRTWIALLLTGYMVVVLSLALRIGAMVAVLASLPLLLPPLLSLLIYWLLWSEFHR